MGFSKARSPITHTHLASRPEPRLRWVSDRHGDPLSDGLKADQDGANGGEWREAGG